MLWAVFFVEMIEVNRIEGGGFSLKAIIYAPLFFPPPKSPKQVFLKSSFAAFCETKRRPKAATPKRDPAEKGQFMSSENSYHGRNLYPRLKTEFGELPPRA
jgi:hypothetical protein